MMRPYLFPLCAAALAVVLAVPVLGTAPVEKMVERNFVVAAPLAAQDNGAWLVATIRATIQPGSWKDGASVEYRSQTGELIVKHTPAVHREIDRLLAQFAREHDKTVVTANFLPAGSLPVSKPTDETPATEKPAAPVVAGNTWRVYTLDPAQFSPDDARWLAENIRAMIQPDSWLLNDFQGKGRISWDEKGRLLIVYNSPAVQDEVRAFLAKVKTEIGQVKPAPSSDARVKTEIGQFKPAPNGDEKASQNTSSAAPRHKFTIVYEGEGVIDSNIVEMIKSLSVPADKTNDLLKALKEQAKSLEKDSQSSDPLPMPVKSVGEKSGYAKPAAAEAADKKEETVPAQVNWIDGYDAARKAAKEKNLPIFIFVCASPCAPCEKMKQTTFQDAEVVQCLNQKFVPLLIPLDDTNKRLITAMKIDRTPCCVFAASDGRILSRLNGYTESARFMEAVRDVVDPPALPIPAFEPQ